MNKEDIINLIIEKFDRVYCCTCRYVNDENTCPYCDKKDVFWAVSREYAEIIANKILEG